MGDNPYNVPSGQGKTFLRLKAKGFNHPRKGH